MLTEGQNLQEQKPANTRRVLSSKDEVLKAMVEVARLAKRSITIMTLDLETNLYDHPHFLDAVKHLCLSRSYARIRVLITNPRRTLRDANRFVYLGRRLSSFIEFRNIHEHYASHHEAFMIADDSAIVFRSDSDRWDGIADTHEPIMSRHYLNIFDEIWAASPSSHEFRHLRL